MNTAVTLTSTTPKATRRQVEYINDLLMQVPDWRTRLYGRTLRTALNAAENSVEICVAYMTRDDAANLLDTLIPMRPTKLRMSRTSQQPIDSFAQLQAALKQINPGRYALPRKKDSVVDFFEVVERKNGTRFLNQLLGGNIACTKFHRKHLSNEMQAAAARAITVDQTAAAKLYANTYHECPRCGVALTHPRSIAASIGEACAKAWGWAW